MKFSIKIKPRGKGRPRFGNGHAFTDSETKTYETQLAWAAKATGARASKLPLKLSIVATFKVPTSMSAKKKLELVGKPHTQRPDGDNILKCADAWNGILWLDDSQVYDARIIKLWGEEDRLDIEVTEE